MLKICFAGLGSIGQRHLRNLVELLEEKESEFIIDAVRCGGKTLPIDIAAHIHQEYEKIWQISKDYDIFFVTNPTVNHLNTIREAITHTRHMFIEKPVFHRPYEQLDGLNLRNDGVYYVACPLRYLACMEYLKKKIEGEHIYSARAISSSYLPDWRKGVDYRKIYSADKQRGGGVTLDLIHELDYLTDLFGMPNKSFHLQGKYSDLEINSDDISLYILQYRDKLVEVHLDYFGKETIRKLELFCRDCVIKVDLIQSTIQYVYPTYIENLNIEKQDMYKQEMKAFLQMVSGEKVNPNSLWHANEVLTLAVQDERNV